MIAPEPILSAALRVLYVAAYTTRNWSLDENFSRKQITALWESIHEIPDLLKRWRPDAEKELMLYLTEYNEKFTTPNLMEIYRQELDKKTGVS